MIWCMIEFLTFSQATGNSKCSAEKLLQFYGCVYHRDTLFVTEELEQIDAQVTIS